MSEIIFESLIFLRASLTSPADGASSGPNAAGAAGDGALTYGISSAPAPLITVRIASMCRFLEEMWLQLEFASPAA